MSQRTRLVIATIVVVLGAPVALVFGGGGVAMCLGPLGVTEVECARNTGLFPNVGVGTPGLALTIALTLAVLVPVERRHWIRTLTATAGGAALGGLLFLAVWPRTLDGLDSHGQWLAVPRPLDPWALLTALVVGAAIGFLGAALPALQRRRPLKA